jgi:hypothetical protein
MHLPEGHPSAGGGSGPEVALLLADRHLVALHGCDLGGVGSDSRRCRRNSGLANAIEARAAVVRGHPLNNYLS